MLQEMSATCCQVACRAADLATDRTLTSISFTCFSISEACAPQTSWWMKTGP